MNVVIVESPAKAKTINKYLGSNYTVLASFGHVRDLPSKNGSVKPDEDFAMEWEVDRDSNKRMMEIAKAVKGSEKLFLATDPDREGEAISWHVMEILKQKRALKDVEIKRVVFNEITKSAILKAMAEPREIDQPMVNAYLARRALDYLVGFTLSPVLWRRLPGAKSAGRVQSVALRLVTSREMEIELFKPQEYWSVEAALKTASGDAIATRLAILDGKKLTKYALANADSANDAAEKVKRTPLIVQDVETKPTSRNPAPPFTTSTLQQEAARKLGFNAQRTMRTAQKLYEGKNLQGEVTGLITYMRTDGVSMAQEAMNATRNLIGDRFGDRFLPEKPRYYKNKSRNAQEAHEAIRPTDPKRLPADIAFALDEDEKKLYDLIWKRTVASQMAAARMERTTAIIDNADGTAGLRATGTVMMFDGFLKLYQEGRDDEEDEAENRLPQMKAGMELGIDQVTPKQHFTEAPPRYTEASLVKKLEELGIGRPSTYASILTVLRERNYVTMDRNRFIPDDKGRVVIAFLEKFFARYVEYDFTARLEDELDRISDNMIDWKKVLGEFWENFYPKTEEVLGVSNTEVIETLNEFLGPFLFGEPDDGTDPRKCTQCDDGRLSLRTGKYGAFVGCSNYPECGYTRPFGHVDKAVEAAQSGQDGVMGQDPVTGYDVLKKDGRFGAYIELDEPKEKGKKPKRGSIPKDVDADSLTLEMALKLLSLPRQVGEHPESGKMITASIGRYGPYVAHDGAFASISSTQEVFDVGVNRAVAALADAASKKRGGAKKVLKELGDHPDGGPINVYDGRYGPYVNHARINATLPKGTEPESVTLEQALEWIAEKAKKKKPARKKAPAKKKPTARKKAAPKKKAAAKKKD